MLYGVIIQIEERDVIGNFITPDRIIQRMLLKNGMKLIKEGGKCWRRKSDGISSWMLIESW